MKYRDLEINFSLEKVSFTALSFCLEKLVRPMPMHSHSKSSYEIHYVSYGYGTLHTQNASYDITPGTLFVTGPEVAHAQVSLPENPMTEYCIYLKVNHSLRKSIYQSELLDCFFNHPFWFGMGDNLIHELMKQILHELETKQQGYEGMLQALLQQFMLQLIRKYHANDSIPPKINNSRNNQDSNDLTYLIIEEAFLYDYKDITLERLASQVALGKRQTERLLQMHYHMTFLQKKTQARMSAACILLKDETKNITEVAYDLGYSSVEHFSNAFKRYFKQTPTEFRKGSEKSVLQGKQTHKQTQQLQ